MDNPEPEGTRETGLSHRTREKKLESLNAL